VSPTFSALLATLPPDSVYPDGVIVPIRPKVLGRCFFPGGNGLAQACGSLPKQPIMLVGQDFGTLSYWNSLGPYEVANGEPSSGTWAAIERWIGEGLLNPTRCFFTNVLLGVRDDVSDSRRRIDGPSPGLSHGRYVNESVDSLLRQIQMLKPSVVVALGVVPAWLLADRLMRVEQATRSNRRRGRPPRWTELDNAGLQFIELAQFEHCEPCAFATSVHPARFWLNLQKRSWPARGLIGEPVHRAIWKAIRDHDLKVSGA
jgi:hypothetical protein